MRRVTPAGFAVLVALTAGCGGGSAGRVSVPSYDPDAAARDAMKQFDKNGDRAIDGPELDAAPGLKAAFAGKKVTADALKARIELYRAGGAGVMGYVVKVTRGGAPLDGAQLTFTPEPFLTGVVREATATTGPDGSATTFTADGESLPGLAPGMYRVSVSKPGVDIPTAYATGSAVGCEVAGGRGGSASLEVRIPGR
jgi:hypothetical protein